MKKIIIILMTLFNIIILIGCNKHKIEFKQSMVMISSINVDMPVINDDIDDLVISEIENDIKRIKDHGFDVSSILIKPYIETVKDSNKSNYILSYVINYQVISLSNDELKKVYVNTINIDYKEKSLIALDYQNIINDLNDKYYSVYSFSYNDSGFIKCFFNDNYINCIISSMLIYGESIDEVILSLKYDNIRRYIQYDNVVNTNNKKIAITFDDGPSINTYKLVDFLNEKKIGATFFILGENALLYPNALKYIAHNNHEIGNHSYSHLNFKLYSYNRLMDEIIKTDDIIYEVTKKTTRLFRFPYGNVNKEIKNNISKHTILWDVDSNDWRKEGKDKIISNILNNVKSGSILLFHDFKYCDYSALDYIIDYLLKDGYEFVSITSLLSLYDELDYYNTKLYYSN